MRGQLRLAPHLNQVSDAIKSIEHKGRVRRRVLPIEHQ